MLPDLVAPDGKTSVAVRHVVYQHIQQSELDQSFITSFGFSYGKKDQIPSNMKVIKQIEVMDPLEQVVAIRHYEPNLYDPQNPYIISETYKSLYHYAKPTTHIAFATKESVHQLIEDVPIFHKKMELLNRTIKVLKELGFQQLFSKDIFKELENIRNTEFILPSAMDKGPWVAEGMVERFMDEGGADLAEVYIGRTSEEQNASAEHFKNCFIQANLLYISQSSFKDFDQRSFGTSNDNYYQLNKNISKLMYSPLLGRIFRSTKLNDSLLFLNTIHFLNGKVTNARFSEIVESSSLFLAERYEDLLCFGKMISSFVSEKKDFSQEQFAISEDDRKILHLKRQDMLGVIDRIVAKRKLINLQQKHIGNDFTKNRKTSRKTIISSFNK